MHQFNLSDEQIYNIEELQWDASWSQLIKKPETELDIKLPKHKMCVECAAEFNEKLLSKRPRDASIPDNLIENEIPNFEQYFEVSQAESKLWTPLAMKVVKYSFAGYGFGCWERTLTQVEGFGIDLNMLHRFVHNHTKMTSFEGYMGVRLDLDDLAVYNTNRLEEVNKLLRSAH